MCYKHCDIRPAPVNLLDVFTPGLTPSDLPYDHVPELAGQEGYHHCGIKGKKSTEESSLYVLPNVYMSSVGKLHFLPQTQMEALCSDLSPGLHLNRCDPPKNWRYITGSP